MDSEENFTQVYLERNNSRIDCWNSSYDCSETSPVTSQVDWTSVTFLVVLASMTAFGNSAICWTVHGTLTLQTSHNRLVVNLAWCDLLMAVLHGPQTILAMVYDEWMLGKIACQLHGFLTTLFGVCSLNTLAVISVNRCCLIVYTGKGLRMFTNKTTNFLILGVWVLSVLCSVPPVLGWSQYSYIRSKALCTIRWSYSVSYTVVVILIGVAIPFCVMFLAYLRIFVEIRKNNRKIAEAVSITKVTSDSSNDIKLRPNFLSSDTLRPPPMASNGSTIQNTALWHTRITSNLPMRMASNSVHPLPPGPLQNLNLNMDDATEPTAQEDPFSKATFVGKELEKVDILDEISNKIPADQPGEKRILIRAASRTSVKISNLIKRTSRGSLMNAEKAPGGLNPFKCGRNNRAISPILEASSTDHTGDRNDSPPLNDESSVKVKGIQETSALTLPLVCRSLSHTPSHTRRLEARRETAISLQNNSNYLSPLSPLSPTIRFFGEEASLHYIKTENGEFERTSNKLNNMVLPSAESFQESQKGNEIEDHTKIEDHTNIQLCTGTSQEKTCQSLQKQTKHCRNICLQIDDLGTLCDSEETLRGIQIGYHINGKEPIQHNDTRISCQFEQNGGKETRESLLKDDSTDMLTRADTVLSGAISNISHHHHQMFCRQKSRSLSLDSIAVRSRQESQLHLDETIIPISPLQLIAPDQTINKFENQPLQLITLANIPNRWSGMKSILSRSRSSPTLRHRRGRRGSSPGSSTHSHAADSRIVTTRNRLVDEVEITLKLFVVILLFIASWAPISLVNFFDTVHWIEITQWVDRFAVCMVYVQSAVNPLIYGLMNRNFRDGFCDVMKCYTCL